MKKITILAAIAAVAGLASCTAQAPKANLKTELDSLGWEAPDRGSGSGRG